jgi:hypothetical protein
MILRLTPPIPLNTQRGPADAHVLIDYSTEHDLMWVCFVRATGECWTFPNRQIRLEKNITMGVRVDDGAPRKARSWRLRDSATHENYNP